MNNISRRDFIKSLAAGAVSVAGMGILAGCGETSAPAATAAPAEEAAAAGTYIPGTYTASA